MIISNRFHCVISTTWLHDSMARGTFWIGYNWLKSLHNDLATEKKHSKHIQIIFSCHEWTLSWLFVSLLDSKCYINFESVSKSLYLIVRVVCVKTWDIFKMPKVLRSKYRQNVVKAVLQEAEVSADVITTLFQKIQRPSVATNLFLRGYSKETRKKLKGKLEEKKLQMKMQRKANKSLRKLSLHTGDYRMLMQHDIYIRFFCRNPAIK